MMRVDDLLVGNQHYDNIYNTIFIFYLIHLLGCNRKTQRVSEIKRRRQNGGTVLFAPVKMIIWQ